MNKANQGARKLGRPLKGRSRRVQIALWADSEHLKLIDLMVASEIAGGNTTVSRSDYYYQAMEDYLKKLGMLPTEGE